MFWMQWPTETLAVIQMMASHLDSRVTWRLAPLLLGVLFSKGRRTVSRWLRAAGLSDDYQDYARAMFARRPGGSGPRNPGRD